MTLLSEADQTEFATGSCLYLDQLETTPEGAPRIVVPITVEGILTQGVVDTGGVYLLCSAEFAGQLSLPPEDALEEKRVTLRNATIRGTLHRVRITLQATTGNDLDMDVTAFVPTSRQVSDLPNFLGFWCCLERIRFAVDPRNRVFYFGCLDSYGI